MSRIEWDRPHAELRRGFVDQEHTLRRSRAISMSARSHVRFSSACYCFYRGEQPPAGWVESKQARRKALLGILEVVFEERTGQVCNFQDSWSHKEVGVRCVLCFSRDIWEIFWIVDDQAWR